MILQNYFIITGNIGAGKTTLCKKINNLLPNVEFYEEPVEDNPYLNLFYNDMKKYSLKMQLFMHYYRMTQYYQFMQEYDNKKIILQDRSIYDQLIFSNVMRKQGILSDKDYNLFKSIYNDSIKLMKQPKFIFYLKVTQDNLVDRIKQRGRECEMSITPEYLEELSREYESVFGSIPNVIEVDYNNFDPTTVISHIITNNTK